MITGGASGIGLGLGRRFAAEGMHVVLADVDEARLDEATSGIAGSLGVVADVADATDVERLARVAVDRFGAVHVVCANAGVTGPAGAKLWEVSLDDWRSVIGVNLFGVIYTLRSFVPLVIDHPESHVVITASMAGLTRALVLPQYFASKHAVVSLAETLRLQFDQQGVATGVSVHVPGGVATSLGQSRTDAGDARSGVPGISPRIIGAEEVADATVEAMRSDRLYVVTHPEGISRVEARFGDILEAFTS